MSSSQRDACYSAYTRNAGDKRVDGWKPSAACDWHAPGDMLGCHKCAGGALPRLDGVETMVPRSSAQEAEDKWKEDNFM
jgi:hypothetical protein